MFLHYSPVSAFSMRSGANLAIRELDRRMFGNRPLMVKNAYREPPRG
jgi:hypothetical protein